VFVGGPPSWLCLPLLLTTDEANKCEAVLPFPHQLDSKPELVGLDLGAACGGGEITGAIIAVEAPNIFCTRFGLARGDGVGREGVHSDDAM
jgi:hypothetical protein